MTEKKITAEMAEDIGAKFKNLVATGGDRLAFDMFGTEMVVTRVGEGVFRMGTGDESIATIYLPSSSAPSGYPADVPFVPGEMVQITAFSSGYSVIWFAKNPEEVAGRLEKVFADDGWMGDESVGSPFGGVHKQFIKGTSSRMLMGGPMVTLIQENGS